MPNRHLRLMCILAHPDDETLGVGGALAKYASEGIETYVVTATRGERGRFGDAPHPGLETVGQVREKELRSAAAILGVREVSFLDYIDGDVDKADPDEAITRIVQQIRRNQPQVVVTFGPEGGYGHPDHIAISQLATAAAVCAADASFAPAVGAAHRIAKLYYVEWGRGKMEAYQRAFREIKMTVDGQERRAAPWPDWAITTQIDASTHWRTVWQAVLCHQTQISIYGALGSLPDEMHRTLWGSQTFYRVFSTVNGGRAPETDLFAGLR